MPSNQALVMSVISGIVFFIVGNPVTYAMVSKITKLSPKKQSQHFLLVGIHAVVSMLVSYSVYKLANLPREKPPPPCPKQKPCPVCEECEECDDSDDSDESPVETTSS